MKIRLKLCKNVYFQSGYISYCSVPDWNHIVGQMRTDSEDRGKILLEDVSTKLSDYSIKTQVIMRSEIVNMSPCCNSEIYLLSCGMLRSGFRTKNNFLNGNERCAVRKHT
jgi:hypothetical protein